MELFKSKQQIEIYLLPSLSCCQASQHFKQHQENNYDQVASLGAREKQKKIRP
jgi:hypothetical protein